MFLSTQKNASQFIEDALIEKIDRDAREKLKVGRGYAQNPHPAAPLPPDAFNPCPEEIVP
jgi:GTP cyclohydrolase III